MSSGCRGLRADVSVSAFAPAVAHRRDQPVGARLRRDAAIAGHVVDDGAAHRAARCRGIRDRPRRETRRPACPRGSRAPAARAIPRCRMTSWGCAHSQFRRAASASAVDGPGAYVAMRRRPRAGLRHAVFDGVRRDEDRDVVGRQRSVRTREQFAIDRREDDDRGPDDRRPAERRDLRREAAACRCGRVTMTPKPSSGAAAAAAAITGGCPSGALGGCDRQAMRAARAGNRRASADAERLRAGDVRHRRSPLRRAARRDRRGSRAGRAARGALPAIRRTRQAASGNCRPARARTRAPPSSRASCAPSASGASAATRSTRSARHSTASAPCPGAGRLSSGSISARMRVPRPEPLQPGRCEDDRVVATLVELAQARVDVAAQRLDSQLRIALAQLRLAAQARRADDRVVREAPKAQRGASKRAHRADPRAR